MEIDASRVKLTEKDINKWYKDWSEKIKKEFLKNFESSKSKVELEEAEKKYRERLKELRKKYSELYKELLKRRREKIRKIKERKIEFIRSISESEDESERVVENEFKNEKIDFEGNRKNRVRI